MCRRHELAWPLSASASGDDFFRDSTSGLDSSLKPWRMPDREHRAEWAKRRSGLAVHSFAYFNDLLADRPTDSFTLPDITFTSA